MNESNYSRRVSAVSLLLKLQTDDTLQRCISQLFHVQQSQHGEQYITFNYSYPHMGHGCT